MNNITEIQQILNSDEQINIMSKIKELKKLYFKDLQNFKYVVDSHIFLHIKHKYIRYIGFNNKLYYGGFFFKAYKQGNNIFISLINKKKHVWTINTNNYYIFINDIISTNDKLRNQFELLLVNYT